MSVCSSSVRLLGGLAALSSATWPTVNTATQVLWSAAASALLLAEASVALPLERLSMYLHARPNIHTGARAGLVNRIPGVQSGSRLLGWYLLPSAMGVTRNSAHRHTTQRQGHVKLQTPPARPHLQSLSCTAAYTCLLQASGVPTPLARGPPGAPDAPASVSRYKAVTCAPAAAGGSWKDSTCCTTQEQAASPRQRHLRAACTGEARGQLPAATIRLCGEGELRATHQRPKNAALHALQMAPLPSPAAAQRPAPLPAPSGSPPSCGR